MRWFIVLLIVANVVLFFWVQQQSRPLPGSMPLPPPDVGRLRLLSELPDEQVEGGAEGIAPAIAEPASIPVDEVAIPSVSFATGDPLTTTTEVVSIQALAITDSDPVAGDAALPEVEPGPAGPSAPPMPKHLEATPAAPEPAPLETAAAVDVIAEMVEQSDVQEPEESAGSLVRESETQGTATESGDTQPEVITASADLQPQATGEPDAEGRAETAPETALENALPVLCYRVGPFDPEGADKLIFELPVSMTLLSDLSEEYSSVDRYYVLIPPLPSRAAGRQTLKELAEAGVTDTWLFPSGEYRNAISLGFFSREGGAKRHAANMVKKGFPAEVREKTSTRERRWLFLKDIERGSPGWSLPLPEGVAAEQKACP